MQVSSSASMWNKSLEKVTEFWAATDPRESCCKENVDSKDAEQQGFQLHSKKQVHVQSAAKSEVPCFLENWQLWQSFEFSTSVLDRSLV